MSLSEKYPRGSEWRKWDLQVHTPFSYLNNEFGSDWDKYVKELFKRALANNIAVIGITDYFSIDGYKKIRNGYIENDKKLKELFSEKEIGEIRKIQILPNIEFRLDNFIEQRINFHVIFSDEVEIKDIEENFLHEIDFVEQGHPQTEDEKRKLKIANLQSLGERLKKEHKKFERNTPIQVGMINAVVDHTQITSILSNKKSLFENKYLIGLPADEDLSRVSWDAQGHLMKKVLFQKADFFISSNPNTREFCLGLKHKTVKEYIDEFHTLKPCIWSSDSHDYEKMFRPDSNRHTWIKADPHFEGLRQVIFEPAERVKIQEDKPDLKKPYFIIDKVRFVDSSRKKFSSDYILLNQNLNTVIGGKSTGKSLFLYYIAKTIDRDEVDKAKEIGGEILARQYSLEDESGFDFEVVWNDGESTLLSKNIDPTESDGVRKIIYIPQHYLNQLSEKGIKSKQTLNTFVQTVLLEDEKASEYSRQQTSIISKTEKEVARELSNLFTLQSDTDKLQSDIKTLGDEKGVIRYIDDVKKEIDTITKKSGLTKEQAKKYEELTEKIKGLEEENASLLQDKDYVKEFAESLKERLDADDLFDEYESNFSSEAIRKSVVSGFSFIKKISKDIDAQTKKLTLEIEGKIEANLKAIAPFQKDLTPLLSKVKLQTELEKKRKILKEEQEKLVNIQSKKKNLQSKQKLFETKKVVILNLYKDINTFYEEWQKEFQKYSARLKDIDLSIEVGFNDTEFNKEVINQFVNKTDLRQLPEAGATGNEEYEYHYNSISHLNFINAVFNALIDGNIKTIKGRTIKDALQKLLENKFYIDFRISYQKDSLDKMSPGKKGLVLLKILIDLSNEEWPIILDQPEDDLDNRSVYTELVSFIKAKKKGRQIIIATHNPNLVVGADSEEVVVANQSGQDVGRDNEKYKFEYVSGSLENSFRNDSHMGILSKMGVRQHVCDVLEGGEEAFQKREQKYDLKY